ncbi:globin-coupled sensor protein [Bosea sp. BK604]|uniref:globin-coupled sensor protein n=1 Tax=Bosea sp. BK604 TaxID=2512180 RepID=UPI0010F3374D|nr:globin-coupled sensor protein [Bosea sp. BK604]TCR70416.1 methyl-accepting chemotaxis protein [Bosea sp. BK604]
MTKTDDLARRLDFMKLGPDALQRIRAVEPTLREALPGALEAFYAQVRAFPETRAFFNSDAVMESAKKRQLAHWGAIANARLDQNFVHNVTGIGEVHAKIGLEPRWYIGGYALLLEQLITKVLEAGWPKGRFGGKAAGAEERAAEIGALVKATLLDMDYAISTYLTASEAARREIEAKAHAAEQAKAQERDKVVSSVTAAMAALAEGDLTYRMSNEIPAEYAQIRDHFNNALARLGEMVSTIKTGSSAIASSAQEINSGAEDLSSRTEQQAAALEETAATTEELAASVKTSAQSSRDSLALADDAAAVARTGGTIVKDAIEAMVRIEQASQKISEITTVIDGIAFQTNLLALNAAVEAARAGDAGKGFAVVAAEVRALAQRSAGAAKDITALIGSSDAEVAEGVRLVRLAGETLEKIVDASVRVSATVNDIASAAGEQANGIDEMSQTVSHMDEITQSNAALAEQSAASARTLLDQIARLNQLVSAFRIADAGRMAAAPRAPERRRAA